MLYRVTLVKISIDNALYKNALFSSSTAVNRLNHFKALGCDAAFLNFRYLLLSRVVGRSENWLLCREFPCFTARVLGHPNAFIFICSM